MDEMESQRSNFTLDNVLKYVLLDKFFVMTMWPLLSLINIPGVRCDDSRLCKSHLLVVSLVMSLTVVVSMVISMVLRNVGINRICLWTKKQDLMHMTYSFAQAFLYSGAMQHVEINNFACCSHRGRDSVATMLYSCGIALMFVVIASDIWLLRRTPKDRTR
jgi:hypothetical protein